MTADRKEFGDVIGVTISRCESLRQGCQARILEKLDELGGKIDDHRKDTQRIDLGLQVHLGHHKGEKNGASREKAKAGNVLKWIGGILAIAVALGTLYAMLRVDPQQEFARWNAMMDERAALKAAAKTVDPTPSHP